MRQAGPTPSTAACRPAISRPDCLATRVLAQELVPGRDPLHDLSPQATLAVWPGKGDPSLEVEVLVERRPIQVGGLLVGEQPGKRRAAGLVQRLDLLELVQVDDLQPTDVDSLQQAGPGDPLVELAHGNRVHREAVRHQDHRVDPPPRCPWPTAQLFLVAVQVLDGGVQLLDLLLDELGDVLDRTSTRLNSSHVAISYAV